MKRKNLKKVFAAILSASMVMSMSLTAFAADATDPTQPAAGTIEEDAPIFAFDVVNVIVPSAYAVAFNPDGLDVTPKTGATAVNDQIVSKNYGIINKSTKDKIITVDLTVTAEDERVEFVSATSDITNAASGEYKIYLAAVPSTDAEVKVGATPAAATPTTAAADLADVEMTEASGKDVAMQAGANTISFVLPKAEYGLKSGEALDLGNTTMAEVKDKFEVKNLAKSADKSKVTGITAFTFGGAMNAKADWSKMAGGVKITAVYSNETAPDGAVSKVVAGTGALYEDPRPKFTSDTAGVISYTAGTGNDALASITKIEMDYAGTLYDGYNPLSGAWAAASHDTTNKVVTLPAKFISNFTTKYPSATEREATITYVDTNGDTQTAKVSVKLK